MIELKKLSKTFESASGSVEALRDIDLTINDGDFITVIGGNGAGKSTMLNTIAGVCKAEGGRRDCPELWNHKRAGGERRWRTVTSATS